MTEAEAALKIGESLGTILVTVAQVPLTLAAPIVTLLSFGSFFWGKRYERKYAKKEKVLMEDISKIIIPREGEEADEGDYSEPTT